MHKQRAFLTDLRSNLGAFSQVSPPGSTAGSSNTSPIVFSSGAKYTVPGVRVGRICLICDRKFMLYDYYSEFACQVEEYDAFIKEDQSLLRDKDREFKHVKRELLTIKNKLNAKTDYLS